MQKNRYEHVGSIREIKVGEVFYVGWDRKTRVEVRRFDTQQEREDYKRYWEYCLSKGIVYRKI